MKNLTKFVFDLSSDKSFRETFSKDPHKAMEDAGLISHQKEIILGQKNQELSKAIADENQIGAEGAQAWTILIQVTINF